MILNSVFEDKVVVNSDEIFDGCSFVGGTTAKQKGVFGIDIVGDASVLVKDCTFANKGYSAIHMNSTGDVLVENSKFECASLYNPIEGSQSIDNGALTIEGCEFAGQPGNNYINFYQFADGVENVISNCVFNPSVDNNIVRVSNRTNAKMSLNVINCRYNFLAGNPSEYTGFMLCQDYTNKNGVKQDFTSVSVELDNVKCNGIKIADEASMGCIFYVYEDGKGIITGENDPIIVVK